MAQTTAETLQIAGHHADVDLTSAPLRDVENYIRPRLLGFIEAGQALLAIRQRHLYRDAGFDSFETYCRDRWQLEERHARHMCDAAQVAQIAAGPSTDGTMVPSVENERQARELAPLLADPEELQAVWQETVKRAQNTNAPVTASTIRAIRRQREAARAQPVTPQPMFRPPAPEPVVPAEVHRVFLILTQACREALALGAPDVFRGLPINPDVLAVWAEEFAGAARLCADLAEACRGGR